MKKQNSPFFHWQRNNMRLNSFSNFVTTVSLPVMLMVILMTTNMRTANAEPLPPCPAKPNCVSSQATDSHHIEPFRISEETKASFEKLRNILTQRTDTRLISTDDTTIRVEFRTFLGFVDDGLFLLDAASGLIHVRSAARTGYWDLGKNRGRMEEIRRAFTGTGP
ncbi:MAG: DUF1499 domain-containing protein [Pseudomonadota bacterium]